MFVREGFEFLSFHENLSKSLLIGFQHLSRWKIQYTGKDERQNKPSLNSVMKLIQLLLKIEDTGMENKIIIK